MCGINGIVRLDPGAAPVRRDELLATRDAMRLRGPDGEGLWLDDRGDAGFGHRRLAIIDLSDAAAQPMRSADGRFTLVFNGEIYNYRRLRSRHLAGAELRGHGDTEVLLELFRRLGPAILPELRGMYTIAVWDAAERTLLLARDPLGIKPLYYATDGRHLRFASQVKALAAGGAVPDDVDTTALAGFLLWGSVPEPFTIRRGVRALPAGHHLLVRDGVPGEPTPHYRLDAQAGPGEDVELSAELEGCVTDHLESDVPVAVFLSAGLDSSLIAALACRASGTKLTTFTLGFDEFAGTERDEAPLARRIAEVLGSEHVERRVSREDFLELYPGARDAMDQPSIDGFNTYTISHAVAAAGFKVVLSGLGGDELMGSYGSFRDVPEWQRSCRRLAAVPGLAALWPAVARLAPSRPKLRGLLRHGRTLPGAYFLRRALFLPEDLPRLLGGDAARAALDEYSPIDDAGKFLGGDPRDDAGRWRAVHVMETSQYMRNQLLRDSDWASMAHSLELRVPLVDAFLRDAFDARRFEPARSHGKAAVVRRAAPELPDAVWSRPKTGFGIPVAGWVDEQLGHGVRAGQASRALALRVLGDFGVDLDPAAAVA